MSERIPLTRQIAKLRRLYTTELSDNAKAVAKRQMKADAAAYEQDSLGAAIDTLEWLQRNEAKIRDALSKPAAPVVEERP